MKKIVLAVTGMSPQIVTELLYALAVCREPRFVPEDVHLITTTEGADRIRKMLLSNEPGWFHRFCKDYSLTGIHFTEANIHVMEDADGLPMRDIITPEDNEAAADYIVSMVQGLTRDPNTVLHASIAGGRKTMGFYLGYALSLYGRSQDELSHVLVSEGYESLTDFFYPTPYEKIIHNRDGKPLDSRDAKVWLADIGYVPMRHGIPKALLGGKTEYSKAVNAVAKSFVAPRLTIDIPNKRLICAHGEVSLPPKQLAFYLMFAERKIKGLKPLLCPVYIGDSDDGDLEIAREFIQRLKDVLGSDRGGTDKIFTLFTDSENRDAKVIHGMTKKYFEECKTRCNKKIREHLAVDDSPYEIAGIGKRPMGYCLARLELDQITIVGCN